MNRIRNAYLGTTGLMATAYLAAAEAIAAAPQPEGAQYTGKKALVHKKDAEGALEIDAFTGFVIAGQHDRPEWADGLVTAQLVERHNYYLNRLGPKYAEEHKNPEVYAFEDLGWLGEYTDPSIESDERAFSLDADDEFRMEVVAQVLGIDRETGDIKGALAETEIASDQTRTDGEMADLAASTQGEGLKAVNE